MMCDTILGDKDRKNNIKFKLKPKKINAFNLKTTES